MANVIKIKKGLDINLKGKAFPIIITVLYPKLLPK